MTLALGRDRDRWPQPIALHRIQTLVLVSSPSPDSGVEDRTTAERSRRSRLATSPKAAVSTEVDSSRAGHGFREVRGGSAGREAGHRISNKLGVGLLSGIGGAAGGFFMGLSLGYSGVGCTESDYDSENTFGGLCVMVPAIYGLPTGYVLGTAIGVSKMDPYDSFGYSLAGSLTGLGAAIGLVVYGPEPIIENFFVRYLVIGAFFMGSPGLATAFSEWSRKPPESGRISFGLMPNTKGRWSAVATLRF